MVDRSLYPADLAHMFAKRSGQSYRPSNGTEGEIFIENWCGDCAMSETCTIVAFTMSLTESHPDYPREWMYGDDGQPKCTAHRTVDQETGTVRCDKTMDLFGAPA